MPCVVDHAFAGALAALAEDGAKQPEAVLEVFGELKARATCISGRGRGIRLRP